MSLAGKFRVSFIVLIGLQALLIAFIPLYFKSLGFSPYEISILSSAENIATMFGPPLLATVAFPRGYGTAILCLLSMLTLIPAIGSTAFNLVLIFWTISLALNRAAFAMINEYAVRSDLNSQLRYSEVRLWGSVSFIAVMQLMGLYVGYYGISFTLKLCLVFLLFLVATGLFLPDRAPVSSKVGIRDFWKVYSGRWMSLFLSASCLHWASHGPLYVYLSIHLEHYGWSPNEISFAWNLGVMSEIFIFAFFSRLEKLYSLSFIFIFSLCLGICRWWAIGVSSNWAAIFISQLLHCFTFAAALLASQKIMSLSVSKQMGKAGQAVLMAVTGGVGTLLGKLAAGIGARELSLAGDFSPLFLGAGVMSLISVLLWVMALSSLKRTNPELLDLISYPSRQNPAS